ncbi:metal-sulfur cluster assembly factor [Bradyrhizobium canariense]|uniref:Metal-sulfur cluster biosynthetic enzyme n=1 Tax=Bradyrhizobium canariense TaxID=255045 RepID=A0A1H2BGA2_9BRAD|nr:metal-sulfur cluster assembly factor [Bradyrhizobium canariense]SDT57107.1 Metal-sulfur cluster biosynthetic enzyme [Bradyrhizobium canariense]
MNTQLAERIRDALRVVIDPELGYNVVDLGFIYDIVVEDGGIVRIRMTTTTPGCPATSYLKEAVANGAWSLPDVEFVDVELTFVPKWSPDMMSLEARTELGFATPN